MELQKTVNSNSSERRKKMWGLGLSSSFCLFLLSLFISFWCIQISNSSKVFLHNDQTTTGFFLFYGWVIKE
jgi:hypothetical protein